MRFLGIEYEMKSRPALDASFVPFGVWEKAYLEQAGREFALAVEREGGKISVFRSRLRGPEFAEANLVYVERLVKFMLYAVGGFRIWLCGCDDIAEKLKEIYSSRGARSFDVGFVGDVYERPLEICAVDAAHFPEAHEEPEAIGGHLDGCRIGFDAGGSDRKVSAVIDGETVYSEEVVWFPKQSEDPAYQYDGILTAFRTAASHMPRVDAIGVSSAGVFVDNCPMVSSLFIKVPKDRKEEVKSIYKRAAAEIGPVPLVVANDGDVSALAGAMGLETGAVMGLAMGTSEAVGYVSPEGKILGWLNELAFAPVDLNPQAPVDEWSGDRGVGCKYLSQDAVIRLAEDAGIALDQELSLAEKLKVVQKLAEEGDETALQIFRTIGTYLAYALAFYARIYDLRCLMVLGRVASGRGGDVIIEECRRALAAEYPALAEQIRITLPDEKIRRVGQSIAAASLPELKTN